MPAGAPRPLPYRVLVVVDAERSVRVYEWPLSPAHPVVAHWTPGQVQVQLDRHRVAGYVELRITTADHRRAWVSARIGLMRRRSLGAARAAADALRS